MNSSFQRVNNIAGWLVFGFSTIVYFLTMEATASFWDCGEFISAAHKLQVVHPPGAPIFLMLGRMFTIVGGAQNADVMMNAFSALSTSFAILFLFWTTTFYSWKVLARDGEWADWKSAAVVATGVIGALVGTFMTSMWFSAVEAEVYALASFFSALIWWAMTKWYRAADRPGGDRWLLFIALMFGLSGGTHLLSLLTIPTICFMYYFRRYDKVTPKGLALTFAASIGVLFFILSYVLDWGILMAAKAEIAFVNGMGLPFNSGSILVILLHALALGWLVHWSAKTHKKRLNTILLSVVFLLIGFSSYAMVLIRAEARPAINMNGITDVHSFYSYIKREQYGSRALLHGPYFTSRPIDVKETGTKYRRGDDKYEAIGKKQVYIYDVRKVPQYSQFNETNMPPQLQKIVQQNKMTIFPRMGSPEGRHKNMYLQFLGLNQQSGENYVPTFGDNVNFFFKYQMGHMFWRYFMWNFSGRQNDRQGYLADDFKNGNWITGINAIDKVKHPQLTNLPPSEKNDFSRNTYFMLPFLLGLLGMIWQYRNDKRGFATVFLFFLFMGIMNIINMNQPPIEPRERDYALVGAFYAYALWIGLGVIALIGIARNPRKDKVVEYLAYSAGLLGFLFLLGLTYHDLNAFILVFGAGMLIIAGMIAVSAGIGKVIKSDQSRAIGIGLICLMIPMLMAFQNWGNHNRSNRTFALDVARNYLSSCGENAILFTQGDNDTYPLWYAQEVEGLRTDVRIINLSLLGVDWYINTLRHKINDADAIQMSLRPEDIQGDKNNYVEFDEDGKNVDRRVDMGQLVTRFVRDNPNPKIPTRKLKLPVNKELVVKSGIVTPDDVNNIPDQLNIQLAKKNLYKNDLMVLDIISTNKWERPVYFAMTVQSDAFLGLQRYFRHDGMCYQFVPVEKINPNGRKSGYGRNMNTDKMYEIIMSDNYRFGGIEKGKPIYRDPSSQNAMLTAKYLLYQQLAFDLLAEAEQLGRISNLVGDASAPELNPESGKVEDEVNRKNRMALEVLDRLVEKFPHEALPYDFNMVGIANMYVKLKQNEKAMAIADKVAPEAVAQLEYLMELNSITEDNTQLKYMADLFGNSQGGNRLACAGSRGFNQLGTIGACATLVELYENIGEQEKADNFRNQCSAAWTANMPLYWPEYIDGSCKRELQKVMGVSQ